MAQRQNNGDKNNNDNKAATITTTHTTSLMGRAEGLMLGLLVGDALGAPVEGWPPAEIADLSNRLTGEPFLSVYIPAIQMGTVVPDPQTGYRWATRVNDEDFVASGPHSDPELGAFERRGYYTDDGNSALALAESLKAEAGLSGRAVALSYAKAWKSTPTRGYTPTAKAVMQAVLDGVDYTKTGTPPYFPFPDGSFANGGAMRISPLALAFRRASLASLREACLVAVRSSHCHHEAVDGAFVQAALARHALLSPTPEAFGLSLMDALLGEVMAVCRSQGMQQRLAAVKKELEGAGGAIGASSVPSVADFKVDLKSLKRLVPCTRPGSGLGFQIAAIDAMACVVWFVGRYFLHPFSGLQRAVGCGGDTDTIGSMVGAIFGSLYGNAWLPTHLIVELENGERGRDYALLVARDLLALDLT